MTDSQGTEQPERPTCAMCGSEMQKEELGWYCNSCQPRRWAPDAQTRQHISVEEFYNRYTPQNEFDPLKPKEFIFEFAKAFAAYDYDAGKVGEPERERFEALRPFHAMRQILKEHWLNSIECLHIIHNDVSHCACGWKSAIQPTVGNAVDEWITHVFEQTEAWQAARSA